jgi:hypothetical protein
VLDATPQSPPLDTDDPGVPEMGVYEINLTTHAGVTRDSRKLDLLFLDANYGLLPRFLGRELPTQLTFEIPVAAAKLSGLPFAAGVGQGAVGLKLNFYNSEHRRLQMSFYPQIEFHLGARAVEKGFAERGQTLIFPLLVSRNLKYFTAVLNGGVHQPLNDMDRHTTGTFGVGLGLAVTRKFSAMAELHGESQFDFAHDRLLTLNVGLMRAVRHAVVYANMGHSLFSDDGLGHLYVGGGVKVLIKPDGKNPH